RLFVAVLGSPYGPGPERGIFRSTDGGQTFQKVLYRDEDTGAVDVVLDPADARTVYAVLWESRQAPWENGVFTGPGSGFYKSTDGGTTWRPLTKGLPTFNDDGLGRIGITVAPSDPRRLYATVEAKRNGGLYRSDDAGESWTRVNGDPRVTERGSDFAEVKVHPGDPDTVFTASVGDDGEITFRDWHPVAVEEYGYVAPDPLDPDIVYGGRLTRYDRRTGQAQNVTPRALRSASFRVLRTAPVLFSPTDPHTLYFASNTLWKTSDGGQAWTEISPDLTRATWEPPANVGKYRSTEAAKATRR